MSEMDLVECDACKGRDSDCETCGGSGEVTQAEATYLDAMSVLVSLTDAEANWVGSKFKAVFQALSDMADAGRARREAAARQRIRVGQREEAVT